MGAFASGLASGLAGGITESKQRNKDSDGSPSFKKFDEHAGGGGGGGAEGDTYKRGGKVKRTGMAKVHKGERVLTKKQARKFERKRGRKS